MIKFENGIKTDKAQYNETENRIYKIINMINSKNSIIEHKQERISEINDFLPSLKDLKEKFPNMQKSIEKQENELLLEIVDLKSIIKEKMKVRNELAYEMMTIKFENKEV